MSCKVVKIPKKNGKFRTIYIPNKEYKDVLRNLLPNLNRKIEGLDIGNVVHGFRPGRNIVTNAEQHIGYNYTTCFDLKDFFDSVKENKHSVGLNKEESNLVFYDGAARQGLPTSPAVANIAATKMDSAILSWVKKKNVRFIYTRYADDLSFSYNEREIEGLLKERIPQIVSRCGFKINPDKTRTMSANNGRRHITGVAVDKDKLYPTRQIVRKLRAAVHQKKLPQAHGLAEFCLLKRPNLEKKKRIDACEKVSRLIKLWKLPRISINNLPDKGPDINLGDNCFITGDPIYTIGMSTFTNGWTSCMRMVKVNNKKLYNHRKTTLFWLYITGMKLAVYLSDEKMAFGNIVRQKMIGRAIVLELENGEKVFHGLYGNTNFLVEKLKKSGYQSIYSKNGKGLFVVGKSKDYGALYLDAPLKSFRKGNEWKIYV